MPVSCHLQCQQVIERIIWTDYQAKIEVERSASNISKSTVWYLKCFCPVGTKDSASYFEEICKHQWCKTFYSDEFGPCLVSNKFDEFLLTWGHTTNCSVQVSLKLCFKALHMLAAWKDTYDPEMHWGPGGKPEQVLKPCPALLDIYR